MPSITSFNVAHLHLLLNHVPTVGGIIAVGILVMGFVRRSEPMKYVALEVLFAVAVITLPAYMTGAAAYSHIRKMPGISESAVSIHQDVALWGFTWLEFTGFVAWVALWQARRVGRAMRGLVPAVLVLAIVSLAVMTRAATLGGDIRHPEVATEETKAFAQIPPDDFMAAKISNVMVNSPWAWPASETVHFLGLSLSFGVLLAVNLRVLGAMTRIPFADVHRLLPWGMLGFGANLVTGMLFWVGQPKQYIDSAPFYWKVVFLMVAGANYLYLTVFQDSWGADRPGWQAGIGDKAMAAVSIFSWLAILYCGRMLPFIGHAF